MNNEVTGAEPVSQPAGQNGPSEYINLSGELKLDPDRIVEMNVELVDRDIPASKGVVGGLSTTMNINNHAQWEKRVLILLKKRPWYIPVFAWRWMTKELLVQSEEVL